MIAAIYIEKFEDLIDEPQTINLGGQYYYEFDKNDDTIIITVKENNNYIPNFFDIKDKDGKLNPCRIGCVTAIVGSNGVGKTRMARLLSEVYDNVFGNWRSKNLTVIFNINDKIYIAKQHTKKLIVQDDKECKVKYDYLDNIKHILSKELYYYSPHIDLNFKIKGNRHNKIPMCTDISMDSWLSQNILDMMKFIDNYTLEQRLSYYWFYDMIAFLNSSIAEKINERTSLLNIYNHQELFIDYTYRNIKSDQINCDIPFAEIIDKILYKCLYLDTKPRKLLINHKIIFNFTQALFILFQENKIVFEVVDNEHSKKEYGHVLYFRVNNLSAEILENPCPYCLLFHLIENAYYEKGNISKYVFENSELIKSFIDDLIKIAKKYQLKDGKLIKLPVDEAMSILHRQQIVFDYIIKCIFTLRGDNERDSYYYKFLFVDSFDKVYSSGQNLLIRLYANLYKELFKNIDIYKNEKYEYNEYLIYLDEADLGYHPTWKKEYLKIILETLPFFFENLKYKDENGNEKIPSIQIIFTTHDPLTLSDMPNNNVVFLKKDINGKTIVLDNKDKARPRKTFGANITDILSNAFFVEGGLIGDFAKQKIEEVISWINKQKQAKSKNFSTELEKYKKVIALIDEPVIRRKLTEMITDLEPDITYYNAAIQAQIEYLESLKK